MYPLGFRLVQWRQAMSSNPVPHPESYFQQDHTKVKDRGAGLGKSPFCHRSSSLDGNLPRPMGFSSVHTPMVWDLWGGKCLRIWKLLKDGWMSGIQGCLEKQPAHHESQSEDKKTWSAKKGVITTKWGLKRTMAFPRGASWNAEWSIHSLKNALGGSCCLYYSVHVWWVK